MNDDFKLSIIIVSYNTKNILKNCLDSIFNKIKEINFEVWVVDNASTDGSVGMIKKEFPKVNIIENKKNVGFAGANNQTIKKANGQYIFLLNPDTIILDENIKEIIKFMDDHQQAGACGPLVLNKNGTMQKQCKRGFPDFWNSFTYYSGLWKLFPNNKWWKKTFGGYFLLDKPDDKICEVDCLSGAAMIFRKEIFNKVGLLSEDYFMYWEDIDICYRIKQEGYKIYFVPLSKVMHIGGAGGTKIQPYKNIKYFYRGGYIFYKKFIAEKHNFFINFLYYVGIGFSFVLKVLINLLKKEKVVGSTKP